MSSKVLEPDDSLPVTPFAFRRVKAEGEENRAGTVEMQRAFQARLAQVEQQCEQRTREAHAAGVREGEAAGRSGAAAELQPVLERLAHSIDDVAGMRPRLRKEAEADLVQLSLAIARRVLRRELAVDPEALHGLVLAALEKLAGQEICRVKVHASHAAMVAAALPKPGGGALIEVIADRSCEPGGIVFETARGNLDVSVESQPREIERGLTARPRRAS